ncbi:MAG TPA: response regulator [Dissulfurispiraceae bacterium]|nr:response regulator [Dissulfurispiraceae bacterium]
MTSGRILIVEDEKQIAETVRLYLERDGFFVVVASTGADALRAVKDGFDLIILDLMLPDMRGEDICTAVREFSDIPTLLSG